MPQASMRTNKVKIGLTQVLQFAEKTRGFEREFWDAEIFGTTTQAGRTDGGMATPTA